MKQPCQYVSPIGSDHHSEDRVKVYYGRVKPAILCGFHASFDGPHVLANLAGELVTDDSGKGER